MAGDVILGVTEAEASARAREWAVQRADARGVQVRDLLIVPTDDDEADAVAATLDASILVLPAVPGHHPYRALVAAAHCPIAVVPETASEAGSGVLVGVDSSDESARALAFAADEAVSRGDVLIALAAWEPVAVGTEAGMDLWTGPVPIDLSESTAAMLTKMLEPVRAAHPDLVIDERVEVGDPSSLIEHAAAGVAVTVVGSHGRTGLARLLLGSVSEHVLEHVSGVTILVR